MSAGGARPGRSLSVRLAVAVTALVAVVLLAAGAALLVALRDFLVDRVDQQLAQLASVAPAVLFQGRSEVDPDSDDATTAGGAGAVSTQGAIVVGVTDDDRLVTATGPRVHAAAVPALVAAADRLVPGELVTLDLDGEPYRAVAVQAGTTAVAVALPIEPVEETVQRLLVSEALVGLAALTLVGVGSYLVVRRGLRPLGRIADEARRIAGTDLSGGQGVDRETVAIDLRHAHDPAEVTELAGALEGMLGHIDASMLARDEAEHQLRQFVADASHELRTPLQSIRGYAELGRRGLVRDPEQAAVASQRIEDEAVRMSKLVDDLLLLARLDQGRPLEQRPVDLVGLAADAVRDASVAAPGRPVDLDAPEGEVRVLGDPDRLRQVLANLLVNARVHTPEGTPVHVRVAAVPGAGRLEVADEGPGIPPEALPHVFDRFFRADPGRSRDRGGSGLGLAIVRSVVEAHGGTVGVDSSPAGTTIRLTLPSA